MDSILQQITDWLKEMLVSAIMGNLSGMFESVNNQVGEIATSVGMTPANFSPGVFAMVRNISESVIIPIAGLILTFIACYELIQMIIDHNNLANFETWIFFKWVFKTFVAVMLITNTFNITMAVFDVTQHVINASAGIISGNTAIDASALETMEETLMAMDLGPLLGLFLQSFIVQVTMSALEAALRNKINNIERTHSGYDEYRYDLDEINHNPYELAAYLTVKFEDYTRDEVQATLQWLFEQQYELTLTEVVEIRTRTTSSTDPETGETTTEEEDYEYYILNVKLRNKGLNSVISNSGLSEDDMERYRILLQTRGNRPDIFGNDIYATPGGEYTDYDIPGEALTDTRFANMIREAEKYLGYPYVWGGSSPSTSFDCSGFVSYVINHCGNGWSVGRLTANGLMGVCDIIPKSSAKPGDLIFFQGTYDTSGASHVGIYVGNGMMIHCGNPISYASIESNYWQQHFYCFGRIRN